jgi:adenylate cyclase
VNGPSSLASWILRESRHLIRPEDLVAGLVDQLREAGVPVRRFALTLQTRHPEIFAIVYSWTEQDGVAREPIAHAHVEEGDETYSPVSVVTRDKRAVRCRLEGGEIPWSVLRELAAQGATDYLMVPLVLSETVSYFSCATGRPGGFADAQLALLESLREPLELRSEAFVRAEALEHLLRVYLGPNAARHVLEGNFRRGTGRLIEAAVWFCDLRGFTSFTDHTPIHEVVALLDAYFEAVGGSVSDRGGEILKFVGDAMLAIFDVGTSGPDDACRRALAAAEDGLSAVAARFPESNVRIGIGLHYGSLMYGNIGARERLDFTAIGPVVNEVCRVEDLCRELKVPLLFTSEFQSHVRGVEGVPITDVRLRGVSQAKALFTLSRYAAAR